jgi:hypothetical protein
MKTGARLKSNVTDARIASGASILIDHSRQVKISQEALQKIIEWKLFMTGCLLRLAAKANYQAKKTAFARRSPRLASAASALSS